MKTKKLKSKPATSDNQKASAELRSKDGLGINGLHLWEVKTNKQGENECLWVTTSKRNMNTATIKAKRFVKANESYGTEINVIKYRGTLDA